MKKNLNNKNKGITLVALVITIIILLILAGISINALTGSGLFEKAKEAKRQYENSANLENGLLAQYEKQINELGGSSSGGQKPVEPEEPTLSTNPATSIKEAKSDYMLEKTVNSLIEDAYGNKITIPAGFKIKVDDDTNNATTVDKGIVIIDENENEFVWIPVPELVELEDGTKEGRIYTNAEKTEYKNVELNRYIFNETTGKPTPQNEAAIPLDTYSCQELQTPPYGNIPAKSITNFKQSVANNKGYYIGRYEARNNSNGKLTEKESDNVYNNVTQANAATVARNMYDNTKPYTSDLMNSYAWDTATLFLQSCGTNDKYSIRTPVSFSIATTGTNNQTTKDIQCNVYDMASNLYEWTTEAFSDNRHPYSPCVMRGGGYGNRVNTTMRRGHDNTETYEDYLGFRPLLYVNV